MESSGGGTWAARRRPRQPRDTPSRPPFAKAHEEAGLPAEPAHCANNRGNRDSTSGSHWTYTTVIADAPELLDTVPNRESAELRWVAEEDVADLPLHPGFAASWAELRAVAASIPLLVNPTL